MISELLEFLKTIDKDFPVPLSEKVSLEEYAKKLLERANIKIETDCGRIVGLVAGYIDKSDGIHSYIAVVGVIKDYRGKSIASKLLKEYIEECVQKGISQVHLYTDSSNIAAINMYKKIGFVEKNDKEGNRVEDVHLFYEIKEEKV